MISLPRPRPPHRRGAPKRSGTRGRAHARGDSGGRAGAACPYRGPSPLPLAPPTRANRLAMRQAAVASVAGRGRETRRKDARLSVGLEGFPRRSSGDLGRRAGRGAVKARTQVRRSPKRTGNPGEIGDPGGLIGSPGSSRLRRSEVSEEGFEPSPGATRTRPSNRCGSFMLGRHSSLCRSDAFGHAADGDEPSRTATEGAECDQNCDQRP